MTKKRYMIIFLLLISLLSYIKSNIELNLKGNDFYKIFSSYKDLDTNNHMNDFISISKDNDLYVTVNIGTPKQTVLLRIEEGSVYFFFSKQACVRQTNNKYFELSYKNLYDLSKYDYSSSKSFFNTTQKTSNVCCKSKETVFLENEIIENFNFLLLSYDLKNSTITCGFFGLSMNEGPHTVTDIKLIDQLKKTGRVNDYYWWLNFTSSSEGKLIIGELPHMQKNNKNNLYIKNNYKEAYVHNDEAKLVWNIYMDEVHFGIYNDNDVKFDIKYGIFNIDSQFIIADMSFKEIFKTRLFSNYLSTGQCKEVTLNVSQIYSTIICDRNIIESDNSKNIRISLYSHEINTNFEFDANDLFFIYKTKAYFLVVFRENKHNMFPGYWSFGIPFLKKYVAFFNPDTKRIGFYIERKENNKNSTIIKTIEILILILIFLFLGYNIYKNMCYYRKKKRNNILLNNSENSIELNENIKD